jgi:hypothetical protein
MNSYAGVGYFRFGLLVTKRNQGSGIKNQGSVIFPDTRHSRV